uniref:HNH endonuclease n=1 Tax=Pithovirus LCPAC104 TaxID=2506589 RepID=A0A481Z3S1_9VIRU|nr:MAG: HNH endonuclease [Pithovirus LCPAC104]
MERINEELFLYKIKNFNKSDLIEYEEKIKFNVLNMFDTEDLIKKYENFNIKESWSKNKIIDMIKDDIKLLTKDNLLDMFKQLDLKKSWNKDKIYDFIYDFLESLTKKTLIENFSRSNFKRLWNKKDIIGDIITNLNFKNMKKQELFDLLIDDYNIIYNQDKISKFTIIDNILEYCKILEIDNHCTKKILDKRKLPELKKLFKFIKENTKTSTKDIMEKVYNNIDSNENKFKEIYSRKDKSGKNDINLTENIVSSSRRKTIPKRIREIVWNNYSNAGKNREGKCFICENMIDINLWHCSHVISLANNGTDESNNLRSLCVDCNMGMGKQNMYDYVKCYYPEKKKLFK